MIVENISTVLWEVDSVRDCASWGQGGHDNSVYCLLNFAELKNALKIK